MNIRKPLIAGATVGAFAAAGIGTAIATSESPAITDAAEDETVESADDAREDEAEDGDTPISDDGALARASEAALSWLEAEHGATGTVSDTEVGDEESHYEIEVTLEDGRQVDVQLTEDFEVVGLD